MVMLLPPASGSADCIRLNSGPFTDTQTHKLTDDPHLFYEAGVVPILWMTRRRHRERLTNIPWGSQDAASGGLAQSHAHAMCSS